MPIPVVVSLLLSFPQLYERQADLRLVIDHARRQIHTREVWRVALRQAQLFAGAAAAPSGRPTTRHGQRAGQQPSPILKHCSLSAAACATV